MFNNSIRKTLLALTGAGLLLSASNVFAHSAHCKDTELGELMKGIKEDLKTYVGAFKTSDTTIMQQAVAEMIAASEKAKNYTPLKLQEEAEMPQMSTQDHAQMGGMNGMPNMAGMSHTTHMEHMRYLDGIAKLNQLFQDLKAAENNKDEVKSLLGQIKQHSKSSHEAFRKDCD